MPIYAARELKRRYLRQRLFLRHLNFRPKDAILHEFIF
jgi:hypothetical protein